MPECAKLYPIFVEAAELDMKTADKTEEIQSYVPKFSLMDEMMKGRTRR